MYFTLGEVVMSIERKVALVTGASQGIGAEASVPMITKGGLNTIAKHLATEYAKNGIRFNAVAPGVVDTPLHKNDPKDILQSLSPMGVLSSVKDIVDTVMYLNEAGTVTGET
jgi:NAD(P)-dependent dehydrogenase (short-subunit alcohol dehydrogenase family)